MLNQLVLVGRLTDDVKKEEEKAVITLAVTRSFKNDKGEYDTDFIPVILNGSIATNTMEYCKKGDVIGVKGRLQRLGKDFTANGYPIIELVAEKVTFLSSTHKED